MPSDLMQTRKGLRVCAFFRRWYIEKLYSCAPDAPDGAIMNRFVRAICIFKYFLPDDTTIHPQSECTTSQELEAWISNITRLSNTVEANALKFVRDKKAAVAVADAVVVNVGTSAVSEPAKKKRKMETYPTYESMFKYLNNVNNVSNAEYAAMKPVNVQDLATKSAGLPAVRFDCVTQFRK